jgi:threonine synthase
MRDFARDGRLTIPPPWRAFIAGDFAAARADETEVAAMMARAHREHAMLIDPHTAVGLVAAEKLRAEGRLDGRVVALATAHPAKFPDAVEAASGVRPALPARLAAMMHAPERCETAPAGVAAIRALILSKSAFVERSMR